MNAPFKSQDCTAEPQITSSLVRGLLRALVTILSSPKGDQGGWEGGTRG
jgi:hypothetical protein